MRKVKKALPVPRTPCRLLVGGVIDGLNWHGLCPTNASATMHVSYTIHEAAAEKLTAGLSPSRACAGVLPYDQGTSQWVTDLVTKRREAPTQANLLVARDVSTYELHEQS
jgi:hypothetical protein